MVRDRLGSLASRCGGWQLRDPVSPVLPSSVHRFRFSHTRLCTSFVLRINPIFLDIIRLPPRSVLSISFVSFTANVATVVIFASSIGYFRRHPLSISASIPEESGIAAVAAAGITAASTRVERRWWYQPRLDVVVRLPCLATLCVASFSPAVPAVPPDSR